MRRSRSGALTHVPRRPESTLAGTGLGRSIGAFLSGGSSAAREDHDRDTDDEARHDRHWRDVGTGGWDGRRRPSEVRLDRLVHLERNGIRREGAASDEATFRDVVEARRGLPR